MLLTVDFAHNDYLQLLAELGLAGFAIGAALAFSIVSMGLRGAMKSSDPEGRYFAVACVGALSAIAVHSLVDFNLYIPANAMLLAWIAGMAVESCESTMHARERLGHPSVIRLVRDISEASAITSVSKR
jgi:O-antigen ligase